jgi:hypothetical protein
MIFSSVMSPTSWVEGSGCAARAVPTTAASRHMAPSAMYAAGLAFLWKL